VIRNPRSATATLFLLASLSFYACSSQQSAAAPPAPEVVLQAIPAADVAQYDHIQDMKKWRNPYLIVRTDGVALFDSADSAEILLKPEELLPALSRLPATNWPYGRVVAAAENGVRASEQDGIAIRRNKGIVGGMLEGAHIAVKWVPST
jgi:hypothetical protein